MKGNKWVDIEILAVPFASHAQDIEALRLRVFAQEQGMPAEIQMDEQDHHCVHVLAFSQMQPIAAGRLVLGQQAQIGRMLVLPEWRGQGGRVAFVQSLM